MIWLAYILVGRLFIFLGQKLPLPDFLEKNIKIKQLHECPLCLGVYLYAGLAYVMSVDVLQVLGISHIPLVSEIVTGGVVSFIVFIFGIGWKDYFAPDIVI